MPVDFKPMVKYKKVLFGRKCEDGGEMDTHLEGLTVNGVEFHRGC